ncbi:MAG: glycosyltransferase family 2 protein [Myxococcales bacterium]|nr:glycosyltransferase family 2 protein [Myxococcales bacterium]MDD9966535.1 glycosyltransferase family 2 protein [Myxococcales bacterium]
MTDERQSGLGAPLATVQVKTPISIVVPTYRERENLPELVARLTALKRTAAPDMEVLIMDDDSQDGSAEWVQNEAPPWVRLVTRTSQRGLGPAVVDGLELAQHPVVVVMDADLSHPPEKIPHLLLALEAGQDFALGSRYVRGGSTDDDWGIFRWLNSRIATALAWPLTQARDPMSGFFALRKADLRGAHNLNPIGYKIGLELIVKCGLDNVGEVPIHFADRRLGQSKLTLAEQLKYLVHLKRLYMFKYAGLTRFVQFGLIGASGVVVNLAVLTACLAVGFPDTPALAAGIVVSVITNFLLNRRFTFSYARGGDMGKQFVGFALASAIGGAIQLAVSAGVLRSQPTMPPQVAALFGVAAGFLFNFAANRFVVFKERHPARRRR